MTFKVERLDVPLRSEMEILVTERSGSSDGGTTENFVFIQHLRDTVFLRVLSLWIRK